VPVDGQVEGETLQLYAVQQCGHVRDVFGGQAVPVHGRQELQHDPLPATQGTQPVEVRDGLHGARWRLHRGEVVGRREHQHVTGEGGPRHVDLVDGSDRDDVDAEQRCFRREPGVAEAVAVALDDRHQAGRRVENGALVGPPAG